MFTNEELDKILEGKGAEYCFALFQLVRAGDRHESWEHSF
jgi:hypothetical protein